MILWDTLIPHEMYAVYLSLLMFYKKMHRQAQINRHPKFDTTLFNEMDCPFHHLKRFKQDSGITELQVSLVLYHHSLINKQLWEGHSFWENKHVARISQIQAHLIIGRPFFIRSFAALYSSLTLAAPTTIRCLTFALHGHSKPLL